MSKLQIQDEGKAIHFDFACLCFFEAKDGMSGRSRRGNEVLHGHRIFRGLCFPARGLDALVVG